MFVAGLQGIFLFEVFGCATKHGCNLGRLKSSGGPVAAVLLAIFDYSLGSLSSTCECSPVECP